MIILLSTQKKSLQGDYYLIRVASVYFDRNNTIREKIKGNRAYCEKTLREVFYSNIIGNYCSFVGYVDSRFEEIELLEDKENVSFLVDIAAWMVDENKNTKERALEKMCKQILKVKEKLTPLVNMLGKSPEREVSLIGLIKTCEDFLNDNLNRFFPEQ